MGIADPGSSQQAVQGDENGGRNQWQFHDDTLLARQERGSGKAVERVGPSGRELKFSLGRARINLKSESVISVSTRNIFLLEIAEIGKKSPESAKKPLKKQGDTLLVPHPIVDGALHRTAART
jgi:hypothetical protein